MRIVDVSVGMRVHWTDPDDGTCSGDGEVVDVQNDEDEGAVVSLRMDDGGEVECLAREIEPI